MQTVLKPFNTVNRRFKEGDTVTEADVPDFADKQARGFISGAKPASPYAFADTAERKKR